MAQQTKIKAILFDFHGVLVFRKKDYRPDSAVDTRINIEGAAAVGMETIWWENKETGFAKFLELLC